MQRHAMSKPEPLHGRHLAVVPLWFFVLIAALVWGAHSSAAAVSDEELRLTFEAAALDLQAMDLTSTGTAAVSTAVVTLNGGSLTSTESRATQGLANRFPAFDSTRLGARAIIRIRNTGYEDLFNPGVQPLSWGADFKIDSVSLSKLKGSTDNGNNLVQRGLAGSRHQFKLQLDGRDGKTPSCRVETAAGYLMVTVPVTVDSSNWYRAVCQRTGDTLTGTVALFDSSGNVSQTWSRTASFTGGVPLGGINFVDPKLPVSIGGKLFDDGTARTAGDQFNGALDNVFIDISH